MQQLYKHQQGTYGRTNVTTSKSKQLKLILVRTFSKSIRGTSKLWLRYLLKSPDSLMKLKNPRSPRWRPSRFIPLSIPISIRNSYNIRNLSPGLIPVSKRNYMRILERLNSLPFRRGMGYRSCGLCWNSLKLVTQMTIMILRIKCPVEQLLVYLC